MPSMTARLPMRRSAGKSPVSILVGIHCVFQYLHGCLSDSLFPRSDDSEEDDAQGEDANHAQVVHGPEASGQLPPVHDAPAGLIHQVFTKGLYACF